MYKKQLYFFLNLNLKKVKIFFIVKLLIFHLSYFKKETNSLLAGKFFWGPLLGGKGYSSSPEKKSFRLRDNHANNYQ